MSSTSTPETYHDSDAGSDSSLSASKTTNNSRTSSDVGLSNAHDQLGRKRRYALDLVNRLRNTGIQTDIDLPQIAVIGNQSAGKSSLIEAISGTTLPRASGTCTRCPTECRLTNVAAPARWNCVVSIRTITDSTGQHLGQARNEHFGEVIYNKAEVEDRIRRAQRAILNPHIPRSQILMGDEEINDGRTLTFSSNYVSLQISGPDIADLSFCDLPGLIRSTKEGSTNDIALVEGLVESYIKKSSCIILLTVSCETDPQNQGALQLAREYDPEGLRTVGVLTKPDRISAGDEEDWVRFVKNEGDYKLLNNWFCVRQPNSSELKLGVTWQEARDKENQFFTATAAWRDLDPIYQRYLRTGNLVERLSGILSDLISKRLPEIREELQQLMHQTRKDLAQLPKEPSQDPMSDISAMIYSFGSRLSRVLEGTPEAEALLQCIRPAQNAFKREIRKTAPNFRPYEKKYASQRNMAHFKFLNNEDDELERDQDSEDNTESGAPIYIDDVNRRIQDARTRELPSRYPYVVEELFIQQITKQWSAPSQRLCEFVYRTTLDHVLRLVKDHFFEFGQGLLERQTRLIIMEHMKDRFEATRDRIEWLLDLEHRPFTMNTHYFLDYKDNFFSYYKSYRDQDLNQEVNSAPQALESERQRKHLVQSPNAAVVNEILAGLIKLGITGVKAIDLVKLLPTDEMEGALDIMAGVRAYFQVAYKRFVDNIPSAIDHEMVLGFERDLLRTLPLRLGIHGPDGLAICKELAQESTQVAAKREELSKKLERMKAGNEELSRIF
ncbi:P-loop containing nucleoside triphosphate hydrolase protein [Lentinula aff. lateritia]|uniref:P-loop containing nucleoside triphosphate hydrolase protein n=1 Tax=Lentinula aff. lateritia TaxID=2804960 RepID=A0ACC1U681_9AGAR|nr:P-loop containing nucleoside triphosphate hydrolase protein [Lentinula aff. lateritia]